MESNSTHALNFYGQKVILKSKESSYQAEEVIALVEKYLEQARGSIKQEIPHQVALLALLNLAEEHLKMKQKVQVYQEDLKQEVDSLLREIHELSSK